MKFDDLGPEARERAREWYRSLDYPEYGWWEDVFADAKRVLKFCGFTIRNIWFDENDACFEGGWHASKVDALRLMAETPKDYELHRIAVGLSELAKEFPDASASIQPGRHCHPESAQIQTDFEQDVDDRFFRELAQDAMRWVHDQVEREYNYLMSDEVVDTALRINEFEFDEEGRNES
jgi:hypothetical protein